MESLRCGRSRAAQPFCGVLVCFQAHVKRRARCRIWSSSPCPGGFWQAKGSFNTTTMAPKCVPGTAYGGALRCCADFAHTKRRRSKKSCRKLGLSASTIDPNVCSRSDLGGKCRRRETYEEAHDRCLKKGARLCTFKELSTQVAEPDVVRCCHVPRAIVLRFTLTRGAFVTPAPLRLGNAIGTTRYGGVRSSPESV